MEDAVAVGAVDGGFAFAAAGDGERSEEKEGREKAQKARRGSGRRD
jgi:hypothetical protein